MPGCYHIQPNRAKVRSLLSFAALAFSLFAVFAWVGRARVSGQITFTDINPNQSTLDPADADGASGGRVNGLASVAGNNMTFYAASEWGGIYRSNDGGLTWNRLNNHRPTVTWDVEVSPANPNRVFATSFYDGRINSLSGINVSTDGGATWTRPATATPPVGLCISARRNEPSAFGIAIDPANPQNIFIGTNCGLAISNDNGATWNFVDPTPGDLADDVWDVVVHDGGIIDVVGDDGHRRSTNGGATWTTATGTPLPSGVASIAVSPDEPNVLFATVSQNVWESDNGGGSWTNLGTPDSRRQGRIPFVAVNDRAGPAFDLWYGDVRLFRAGCTSNPMGGGLRCPIGTLANPLPTPPPPTPAGWAGPFTRSVGGHDDVGDLVFDTAAANDACPRIFSTDGGVYRNTSLMSPACHTPAWEQPNVTPHGLWLWTMTGVDQAGNASEDLYFGNQDNGSFAATDGGAATPTWSNVDCCDIFDTAAESNRVLYTFCCGQNRATRLVRRGQGMVGGGSVNDPADYPADGLIPGFVPPDSITRFGAASYALITVNCNTPPNGIDDDGDMMIDEPDETRGCSGVNGGDGGIHITTNAAASPIAWTELGPITEPPTGGGFRACGIKSAVMGGTPTFYVQVGVCDGRSQDQLWRFTGTNPAAAWAQVNLPPGGIGVFDVDPNNPNRVIASQLNGTNVNMVLTTNGGTTWTTLAALDNLMTGGGVYNYRNTRGPTDFTGLNGYPQPTLVAFDPSDGNTIVAGGADSGVFLSTDGGNIWTALTDNTGGASNPHLPRPRFAYFDREGGAVNIYVGTQGRGVWRISFPAATADLAGAKIAAPNPVVTGANVTYTINVNNGGPNAAQSVTVVDNLPASVSFVSCAVMGGTGGACGGAGNNRTVTFTSLAANASATITLVAQVNCSVADGAMISNTASVSSLATDPNLNNNTAMVTVAASNPPPMITCPPNQNGVTPDPGDMNAMVTYPAPTVMDNCPGASAACVPPSGSIFPLGITPVTCTATDSGGQMANCQFNVTVWDVCLQDDASGDILFFNSFTGDYLFIRCAGGGGFTLAGKGLIKRVGCLTMLIESRVTAKLDRCPIAPLNIGSATIKPNPIGGWFHINDRNIENNTCVCP